MAEMRRTVGTVVKRVVQKPGKPLQLLSNKKLQPFKHPAPSGGYQLPEDAMEPCSSFFKYMILLYGRPGIGKTTWAASFPGALILPCERVSKGIKAFVFNWENGGVTTWEVLRSAVDLLEMNPKKFQTIVIDTIDAAYAHCMDYVCRKEGIDYPRDDDRGKTWKKIMIEFSEVMDRIQDTGAGIVFISHAKESTIQSHTGEKYSRIQPTMSGSAYNYVKAKTDFMLYAEYYRDKDGEPMRILITSGDDVVDAKSAGDLPRFLPFTKEHGVDIIVAAFNGEDVGLLPDNLRAGKETSKGGMNLLAKARVDAVTVTPLRRVKK